MTLRKVLLVLCVAAIAAPASAQRGIDYGRPVSTPRNNVDGAFRRAAMCLSRDSPARARAILETGIGTDQEAKAVKSVVRTARDCFMFQQAIPEFNPTTFRTQVAEAVYLNQFRLRDPEASRSAPVALPASFAVHADDANAKPSQRVAWQLAALARCAVFVDPAGARNLILGPRNVEEEQKRFNQLAPAIRKCTDRRTAAEIGVFEFRGFIADALLVRAEAR